MAVEVFASRDEGEQWCVSSEDVVEALSVCSGHQAQAIVQEVLARYFTGLLERVDFDSYDVVFSAYAGDEATARALADAVARAPQLR